MKCSSGPVQIKNQNTRFIDVHITEFYEQVLVKLFVFSGLKADHNFLHKTSTAPEPHIGNLSVP